jgi:hypothetical protein
MFISLPKITPITQPLAIEKNKLITLFAKESSRKNNKKQDPCGLKTITICIGLPPIDYTKFTNNILIKLNLVKLL